MTIFGLLNILDKFRTNEHFSNRAVAIIPFDGIRAVQKNTLLGGSVCWHVSRPVSKRTYLVTMANKVVLSGVVLPVDVEFTCTAYEQRMTNIVQFVLRNECTGVPVFIFPINNFLL